MRQSIVIKKDTKLTYPILDVFRTKSKGSYHIIISRIKSNKQIQSIIILIDAWKMGLKDVIVHDPITRFQYKILLTDYTRNLSELERISLEEAYWHIQYGLRIARAVGTCIPKEFFKNSNIIGNYSQVQVMGSLYKCYECEKGELSEDIIEEIKNITKEDMKNGVCGTESETLVFFTCQTCQEKNLPEEIESYQIENGEEEDGEAEFDEDIEDKEKEIENYLEKLYISFSKSLEFKDLPHTEQEKAETIIILFGIYMYRYYDQEPHEWDNISIEQCCVGTLIERVSGEPEFFESICPVLTAFFNFLKRKQLLPNAAILNNKLSKIHDIILERYENPKYWSFSKHFFNTAEKMDIDIRDEKALKKFARTYESLYTSESNNLFNNTTSNKISRNEPCYCGSGLKYKKCHWAKDKGLA